LKAGILDSWMPEWKQKALTRLQEKGESVTDYNNTGLIHTGTADVIETTRKTIQVLKKSSKSTRKHSSAHPINLSITNNTTLESSGPAVSVTNSTKKRKRSLTTDEKSKKRARIEMEINLTECDDLFEEQPEDWEEIREPHSTRSAALLPKSSSTSAFFRNNGLHDFFH